MGIATGDDHRASIRREGFVAAVGHEVPTAVVPAPSNMAQGVLAEALVRGLRIPADLAVCGFGGADFAAHMEPALTTVHVDGAAIGRLAAQLLLQLCQGHEVAQRVVDVGFRIIERRSTHDDEG